MNMEEYRWNIRDTVFEEGYLRRAIFVLKDKMKTAKSPHRKNRYAKRIERATARLLAIVMLK